jgi:cupin 2 domain-containing protein
LTVLINVTCHYLGEVYRLCRRTVFSASPTKVDSRTSGAARVSSSSVNLLSDIPHDLPAELTQTLAESSHVRIERIVSRGHVSSPGFWYDQDWPEWVTVIRGNARVQFENGETVELTAGSFLDIPAHRRHRVEWTDPNQDTIWLAIYDTSAKAPPRRK